MTLLVTGGSGFIGSNFILNWLESESAKVTNLDLLTYSGNQDNLADIELNKNYNFVRGDIGDTELVKSLLLELKPTQIVNFAAESHVDRSIHGPEAFIRTNIIGTFHLLECVREYWSSLPDKEKKDFKFLHVSTDEVYGSLDVDEEPFTETNQLKPNSPYSASKASSDHLVRAWNKTFGLPVITTNCSNNYGPYQFPEKLIPLVILNALSSKQIPVYGDGKQIRDWLYVGDHCSAIRLLLNRGITGEVYNIGGFNEVRNIDLVNRICSILDELKPDPNGSYTRLIHYVTDRPGHDYRYAIDSSKMSEQLGWKPSESISSGLEKTISWYLNNLEWLDRVNSGEYQNWIDNNYKERK